MAIQENGSFFLASFYQDLIFNILPFMEILEEFKKERQELKVEYS